VRNSYNGCAQIKEILQEKKFRLQNKFDDLKDKGKRVMENIGEKRMDMISKWEEKSRDFIDAFLLLFGREGRLVCMYMRTRVYACFPSILSYVNIKIYSNFLFVYVVNNLE